MKKDQFSQICLQRPVVSVPCLPMCVTNALHIFTKIGKPVYAALHERGQSVVGYISDIYLQSSSFEEGVWNSLCLNGTTVCGPTGS